MNLPVKVTFNAPTFLVVITTVGVFFVTVLLFFVEIPKESSQMIYTAFTLIIGKWGTMVDFHFGSSAGSKAKTELMGAPTTETTATPDKVVTVTSPASKPAEEARP